LMSNLHFH